MSDRSMAHEGRFGVGATSGSAATNEFIFQSTNIGKTQGILDPGGIGGGTRSRRGERVINDVYTVGGQVVIRPSPADLDFLLPWILGADEAATDTFALAEAIKQYGVDIDKGDDAYRYALMSVNSAIFRSSKSQQFLELVLNLVGTTETAGITFPSIEGTITTKRPYAHLQSTLTLDGTAQPNDQVEVVIDNRLQADFFENSSTVVDIESGDRVITLSTSLPFDATSDELYEVAIGGLTGTNTLVYTDGTDTLTFTFENLKAATNPLEIPERPGEIRLGKLFQAYQTSTDKELVITNTNN